MAGCAPLRYWQWTTGSARRVKFALRTSGLEQQNTPLSEGEQGGGYLETHMTNFPAAKVQKGPSGNRRISGLLEKSARRDLSGPSFYLSSFFTRSTASRT